MVGWWKGALPFRRYLGVLALFLTLLFSSWAGHAWAAIGGGNVSGPGWTCNTLLGDWQCITLSTTRSAGTVIATPGSSALTAVLPSLLPADLEAIGLVLPSASATQTTTIFTDTTNTPGGPGGTLPHIIYVGDGPGSINCVGVPAGLNSSSNTISENQPYPECDYTGYDVFAPGGNPIFDIVVSINTHTDTLSTFTLPADSAAVNWLQGSLHPDIQNVLIDDGNGFITQLLSRPDQSALFVPQPIAYVDGGVSSPALDQATAFAGARSHADLDIGAWFSVLPRATSYNGDASNFGFRTVSGGLAAGIDQTNGGVSYGVAFSLDGTTLVQDTTSDRANIGTARLGAYASYELHDWTITAAAALGLHRIETTRLSALATPALATYGAGSATLGLEAVGSFELGDALFEPLAGVVFSAAAIDAFTETGPLAISGLAETTRSLEAYAGGRLSTDIVGANGMVWTPQVRARVGYDLIQDPRAITATFVGVPGPFIVNGLAPSPLSATVGAGIDLAVNDSFGMSLSFDSALRASGLSHAFAAKAHGTF